MSDLVSRLRSSAAAFRQHNVYSSDGDPIKLIVQADECLRAADRIEEMEGRLVEATSIINAWRRWLKAVNAGDDCEYLNSNAWPDAEVLDEKCMMFLARAALTDGGGDV